MGSLQTDLLPIPAIVILVISSGSSGFSCEKLSPLEYFQENIYNFICCIRRINGQWYENLSLRAMVCLIFRIKLAYLALNEV